MKKLTFNSIKCVNPQTGKGDDEVFLMVQVDGGPPLRFPVQDFIKLNKDVTWVLQPDMDHPPVYHFEKILSCSVWDYDGPVGFLNEADFLGGRAWNEGNQSKTYTVKGNDDSEYELDITIEDSQDRPHINTLALNGNFEDVLSYIDAWIGDFLDTQDGQDILNKSEPAELLPLIERAILHETFERLKDLIFSIIPIKAISIGLSGQVDLFVGITGAFGVATDLRNFGQSGAFFGAGGFVEGADIGAEGSVTVGLWFIESSKIGGFYEGVELDAVEGIGLSVSAWAARGSGKKLTSLANVLDYAKAVFVGFEVGLDDGAEGEEIYCIAGHNELYPSFQTGKFQYSAVIETVQCLDQVGSDGHDEVEIYWTVDGEDQRYKFPLWGHVEMNTNNDNILIPGAVIKFNKSFNIELVASNQRVETQRFTADEFQNDNEVRHSLTGHHGSYSVVAQLVNFPDAEQ